jgi:hypothetical protein
MERTEIIQQVHANIGFFRDRWVDFCAWVEKCGEELAGYQAAWSPDPDGVRCALNALLNPVNDARGRLEADLIRELEIDTRPQVNRLVEEYNAHPEVPGDWAYWSPWDSFAPGYKLVGLNLPPVPFYAPREAVNPVLWLLENSKYARTHANRRTYPNPRLAKEPEESDLLAIGRLSVAHDTTPRPTDAGCLYRDHDYKGQYFLRDDVHRKLDGHISDDDLRYAWDRVEGLLPQAEKDEQTLAGSTPIHIDLGQWKQSKNRNLMQDLLDDDLREGVTIKLRRHGASQPKELRRSLREEHKLPTVAKAITLVKSKVRTYKLTLSPNEITCDRPQT